MKRLVQELLPTNCWRPREENTARNSNRTRERELDRIAIRISHTMGPSTTGQNIFPVKLWDYSPFGFALLYELEKSKHMEFEIGDRICLSANFGSGTLKSECVVQNRVPFKNSVRLGLLRSDLARHHAGQSSGKAPAGGYIRLDNGLTINAEIDNPILYGESCQLHLCGIRAGMHFDFLSSDPSLMLFIGQKIEIRLALPTSGNNIYRGIIVALEKINSHTIRIRMQPIFIPSSLANDLAEVLTFRSRFSPETLRSLGFPVRIFRNRITFGFVENMQDYKQVLQLRRKAYVEAGKREAHTTESDMSIDWDKSSRILCAFHDGVLVASAALTFPASQATTLRTETAFPNSRFPEPMPNKKEILEINSLCTHHDYRRGDLLQAVFEQIARIFVLSDRNFIMNLSDSHLLPMYLAIGFKDMHQKGVFLGIEHNLIKAARNVVIKGHGLGLMTWCILYGDLVEDLIKKRLLILSNFDRLFINMKLTIKPLAKHLMRNRHEKQFHRFLTKGQKG